MLTSADAYVVDACSVINLAAAFGLEHAAEQLGCPLLVTRQAAEEALFLYDVVDGEQRRRPISVGALRVVDLAEQELGHYVRLTSSLGDGEAASLAVGSSRNLTVLTNDRVARRKAREVDPPVVTIGTPALLHAWSTRTAATDAQVIQVLRSVELRASFRPARTDPHALWWRSHTDTS